MPLGINESISQVASRFMSEAACTVSRSLRYGVAVRGSVLPPPESPIMTLVGNAHPRVYDDGATVESRNWRSSVPAGVRPYIESAPLAALFLGISSGAPLQMIAATLTTRLAQFGIRKSAVTMFALTFLAYNFKFIWAPLVDNVRIPLLGRFGQRRSWLWVTGVLVMVAIGFLGGVDPQQSLSTVAIAALLVG